MIIEFSLDGGHTFSPILGPTNANPVSWTVPDEFTSDGVLRVQGASGNGPAGTSAVSFVIPAPITNVTPGATAFMPGTTTTIQWTDPAGFDRQASRSTIPSMAVRRSPTSRTSPHFEVRHSTVPFTDSRHLDRPR